MARSYGCCVLDIDERDNLEETGQESSKILELITWPKVFIDSHDYQSCNCGGSTWLSNLCFWPLGGPPYLGMDPEAPGLTVLGRAKLTTWVPEEQNTKSARSLNLGETVGQWGRGVRPPARHGRDSSSKLGTTRGRFR